MNDGYVSKDDLDVLSGLANDKARAVRTVETANMQKQAVDLLYENTLLKIYLKYGLRSDDSFNDQTGLIIRGDKGDERKDAQDTE